MLSITELLVDFLVFVTKAGIVISAALIVVGEMS